MSEEVERSDSYYEVQVDRETLVLLGFGFVALLVAAFLVGRWTAPSGADGDHQAAQIEELADFENERLASADGEAEDVDGEPLFGGSPVSAEGAPPIGAVPEEPLPAKDPEPETKPAAVAKKTTPVAKRPTSAPIPKAAAEGWVVQVSAVKSSRDAKALQDKLQAKGWPVRVLREMRLSEDGEILAVIELRSSRNKPIVRFFKRG